MSEGDNINDMTFTINNNSKVARMSPHEQHGDVDANAGVRWVGFSPSVKLKNVFVN